MGQVMHVQRRKQLPELLKHLNLPLIAAEIGVERGMNSTDLLKYGIEEIYCIDSWEGDEFTSQQTQDEHYKKALENLSQFDQSRVHILRGLSSEMHVHIPDNTLGLIYIDGNHSYKSVKEDILNYEPKLVQGGVIALHDYVNIVEVSGAVNEYADANNLTVYIIPESNRGDAGAYFIINRK